MHLAYWQFYKTIFPFIAAFSIVCIAIGGLFWGFLLFSSTGPLIGYLGFASFYKKQIYFFHNLGLSRLKLISVSFVINLLVGIPLLGISIVCLKFFLGSTTII